MKQIARWYLKIVEAICVCLLLVILGCMCFQIACRLFTIGQNFTEELSRLAFRYFRRYDSQHFTKGNPQSG